MIGRVAQFLVNVNIGINEPVINASRLSAPMDVTLVFQR